MALSPTDRVNILDDKVGRYVTYGWTIAGIYAVIFGGFLTWYLPKELDAQKNLIVAEVGREVDKVAKLQLDKLIVQVSDFQSGKTRVSPQNVQKLGADTFELVNSKNPEVSQRAWQAANGLVSYFSFVNPVNPAFIAELEKKGVHFSSPRRELECMHAFFG